MAWAEGSEYMEALDWEEVWEIENEAMVDSPRIEKGSYETEAKAMADSTKPKTTSHSPIVVVTYDAVKKVNKWYAIRVVNVGVGILIAEELP